MRLPVDQKPDAGSIDVAVRADTGRCPGSTVVPRTYVKSIPGSTGAAHFDNELVCSFLVELEKTAAPEDRHKPAQYLVVELESIVTESAYCCYIADPKERMGSAYFAEKQRTRASPKCRCAKTYNWLTAVGPGDPPRWSHEIS